MLLYAARKVINIDNFDRNILKVPQADAKIGNQDSADNRLNRDGICAYSIARSETKHH